MARYAASGSRYVARGREIESQTVPPGSVTVAGTLVVLSSLVFIGFGVYAFVESEAITEWFLERPRMISLLPPLTDADVAALSRPLRWSMLANGVIDGLLGLLFARGLFRRRLWAQIWVIIGSIWMILTFLPAAIFLHAGCWLAVAVGLVVLVLLSGSRSGRWFRSRRHRPR